MLYTHLKPYERMANNWGLAACCLRGFSNRLDFFSLTFFYAFKIIRALCSLLWSHWVFVLYNVVYYRGVTCTGSLYTSLRVVQIINANSSIDDLAFHSELETYCMVARGSVFLPISLVMLA